MILLDLMLPGMHRIEVCRGKRKFSQVPIIIVTAQTEEIDRLLGLELGADDYVSKSFNLLEAVARGSRLYCVVLHNLRFQKICLNPGF